MTVARDTIPESDLLPTADWLPSNDSKATGREPYRSIVVLHSDAPRAFPLERDCHIVVGRDESAHLVIPDETVSRRHAIVHGGPEVFIEDVGGANGIILNGKRVAPNAREVWRNRDVVQLGRASLILHEFASRPSKPAPAMGAADVAPGRILLDPKVSELDAVARSIAAGNIPVLLTGETGTGKEIFAGAIHRYSSRANKPFLSLNCAALNETLLESELFGYERGAFTGALHSKPGLLETADGGVVFLDEIGEMPMSLQAKLLRVLEEHRVMRVGAVRAREIHVRIVSATNRDLMADVERGTFRRDLYYRINGAVLVIPPLRERLSEIEPLANMFAQSAARELGLPETPTIAADVLALLRRHPWPGNIRELRNVVERAVLLSRGGPLMLEHVPAYFFEKRDSATNLPRHPRSEPAPATADLPGQKAEGDEISRIVDALKRCGGNQTRAAKLLGIGRSTLCSRLAAYKLPRPKDPT